MDIRYRIRVKNKIKGTIYYTLDKLVNEKVVKSWALNPEKLAKYFECPIDMPKNIEQNPENKPETFAHDLLNEPQKQGILKQVQAAQEKLMSEILK